MIKTQGDIGGENSFLSSDGKLLYGKYRGCVLEYVAEIDIGYLRWCLEEIDYMAKYDRQILQVCVDRNGN